MKTQHTQICGMYLKQYVEEKIQHENAYIKKNMPQSMISVSTLKNQKRRVKETQSKFRTKPNGIKNRKAID